MNATTNVIQGPQSLSATDGFVVFLHANSLWSERHAEFFFLNRIQVF